MQIGRDHGGHGGHGRQYRGRFAPSPTGPLHAGSLVAALASWLDARVHHGAWLLRIEDIDSARCSVEAVETIGVQLAACGLLPTEAPELQSQRGARYAAALARLTESSQVYPCACTRSDIESAWAARGVQRVPGANLPYPGTCRNGLQGRPPRALRFRLPDAEAARVTWQDRWLGVQTQDVAASVGDFVLRRADGLWAYQLAVVVDDAAQGISDVVRGADLADNTARQILLQRALGVPTPRYLHTPLVWAADGRKLSKQNGAAALRDHDALRNLHQAGAVLGLPELPQRERVAWLQAATSAWAGIMDRFNDNGVPA